MLEIRNLNKLLGEKSFESFENKHCVELDSSKLSKFCIKAVLDLEHPVWSGLVWSFTLIYIVDKRSCWAGFGGSGWSKRVMGECLVDSGCHKLSENIWFVWSQISY